LIIVIILGEEYKSSSLCRPLGKARRRWQDDIKMDHRGIGLDGMDQIELAQDRDQWNALVKTVKTFGFMKCWEMLE
jgi:hypothetical protein